MPEISLTQAPAHVRHGSNIGQPLTRRDGVLKVTGTARYAADKSFAVTTNADDEANNALVLRELKDVPFEKRSARFVCVLAVARDGQTIHTFRGSAEGVILDAPRGQNGFGYDPLFYFPQIGKTFAELNAEEKAQYSHRGAAFRAFLSWYRKT